MPTFLAHLCIIQHLFPWDFFGINNSRHTVETGTSLPKSLEPDTESVFTSRYLVGKFRIEKNFEFFIRACARKGSNEPTSACPSDNSWKESRIQEGSDNSTMIYQPKIYKRFERIPRNLTIAKRSPSR